MVGNVRDDDAVPTESDWGFLAPWIEVFSDRRMLAIPNSMLRSESDPVRIGVDPCNDFWMYVQLEREEMLQIHPEGEQGGMRELREAVILVHLLATANYDLWYKWMVTSRNFDPPPWFIPEDAKIRMRYEFELSEQHDLQFLSWENSLAFLLGDVGYSDDFLNDLELTKQLLFRHGVAWETLPPIPIKLRCEINKRDGGAKLERITSAIKEIERLESQRVEDRGGHLGRGTTFQVALLDLQLSSMVIDSRVFEVLHQLLRVGIPIDTLWLPQLPALRGDQDDVATMERVGDFMRTVCGLTQNQRHQQTQVRNIAISFAFCRSHWFAPFCSALAITQSIRLLHLYPVYTRGLDADAVAFGRDPLMRRHIWSWLAFALFSSVSSTSTEALTIIGEALQPADVEAARTIVASSDPLGTLYRLAHDLRGAPAVTTQERPMTEIILNGNITVRDAKHTSTFLSLRRLSVRGRVIEEGTGGDRAEADVFIPGLGFCRLRHDTRPTKRVRLANHSAIAETAEQSCPLPSSFKTFKIKTDKSPTNLVPALVNLMRLLGPRLRGLSLDIRGVDDHVLREIFVACRHLESLALCGVKLASMAVFEQACNELDLPLSSLHLTAISVQEASFQRFLRLLLACTKTEATLTRLAFGYGWAHELSSATFAILGNVLDHNKTLTHVEYSVTNHLRGRMGNVLSRNHGQLVEGLSYAERSRRVAFLGGVRRVALTNPSVDLNANVKMLVLEFAAPRPLRRVVSQYWTEIGGPSSFPALA